MNILSVEHLAEQLNGDHELTLIDVREPWEYKLCHIDGSVSVPLSTVPDFIESQDPSKHYVFICHHGIRSARAAAYALAHDFDSVFNLTGGVAAWAARVDPDFPTY